MTLADLASLICTKLNQLDTEDVAACKLFLARRYEMIWNDQLWKDALIDWTYTLPDAAVRGYTQSDIWLPKKQVLILPPVFDRVLAARTDTRRLNVQSPEIFYRTDYDNFQNGGLSMEYVVLPPVVWEFDKAQYLRLTSVAGDNAKTATADILESDGITLTRYQEVISSTSMYLTQGTRIDSLSRDAVGSGSVAVGWGPRDNHYLIQNTSTTAATFVFNGGIDGSGATIGSLTVASGDTVEGTTCVSVQDPSGIWTDPPGPNFTGVLVWNGTLLKLSGGTPQAVATLGASSLAMSRRLRLRLMGSIDTPVPTVRVMGKAKPNTLSADNDSTALTGVDNALIAAAEFDMLQRERQYGKAELKFKEFGAHLDQLKRSEVVQAAYNKRIIPEDGYGNPNDMMSHPPLSF